MAKSIDLRVKVVEVKDTVEVGSNGFKKREVIGMEEGEYPQYYKFEFIKEKVASVIRRPCGDSRLPEIC